MNKEVNQTKSKAKKVSNRRNKKPECQNKGVSEHRFRNKGRENIRMQIWDQIVTIFTYPNWAYDSVFLLVYNRVKKWLSDTASFPK